LINVLIIGSDGFLGKNLSFSLLEKKNINLLKIKKKSSTNTIKNFLLEADLIFFFAGVNRPKKNETYKQNHQLVQKICNILIKKRIKKTIVYSSSSQILFDNPYGKSKKKSEEILIRYSKKLKSKLYIYRLPNIFGKWSKPNYNSVVSTFCYNVSRQKKIFLSDPRKKINLIYIDDVIESFVKIIFNYEKDFSKKSIKKIKNITTISLGKLANIIKMFEVNRKKIMLENFSSHFIKNLYSTYISFLPKKSFCYYLKSHKDTRGSFTEFIKSKFAGQVSFFTSRPGISRGFHFHNSKVEKFVVLLGTAKFVMQDISSNKKFIKILNYKTPEVLETIPGYTHYIKNIGKSELSVLLWSSEIFKKNKSDTISYEKN
jgi:UDP-2-acetamido-2,6-beta-L-arabino-hexul-4-ose reductase